MRSAHGGAVLVLELTPADVGPNRTRLAVAYIECVMLWPDDPTKQTRGYETALAERIGDAAENAPFPIPKEFMRVVLNAEPKRIMQESIRQSFERGVTSGR